MKIGLSQRLLEMNFMKNSNKNKQPDQENNNDNWVLDANFGDLCDDISLNQKTNIKKRPTSILKKIYANSRLSNKKKKKKTDDSKKNNNIK